MLTTLIASSLIGAPVWQPLFDGKSTTGWTQLGGSSTFRIENGAIIGESLTNQPNTFLCTTRTFADFELELEFKVEPGHLSGVQFRSNAVKGYRDGAVFGYQSEIDPTRGFTGGIYEEGRRGWVQDLASNSKAKAAYKAGIWNKMRIRAVGDHIQTWVNSVPCANLHDRNAKFGFIALQAQSVGSGASKKAMWRNIRIKDLSDAGALPKGSRWLLNAMPDMAKWQHRDRPNSTIGWKWVNNALQVNPGTADIETREKVGSGTYHIEFRTEENGREGQENGNSGVYFQGMYEVQVLNSYPRGPMDNECGGIYKIAAPQIAMAYPAHQWQTYDVEFTSAKWKGTEKLSNARISVWHNGVLIHDNLELPNGTAAGKPEKPEGGSLLLQNHGNLIEYRNIWFAPSN